MAYITNTKKIVEGSSISINDNEKLIDLELKGNTTQDGTPTPSSPVEIETVTGRQEVDIVGKNVFNINGIVSGGTFIKYNNGMTLTKNVNRTCRLDLPITLQAGTYTLSCDIINSTLSANNKLGINLQSGNATIKSVYPLENRTFTISQSFNQLHFFINSDQLDNATITIDNIQLEVGDEATSYEPYIDKNYEINLGKNLFKPISYSRRNSGINYVYDLDGSINCDGTATANSYSMLSTDAPNYMFQINPGTYTISGALTNVRLQVIKYDNGSTSTLANTTSSASFTVNSPTNIYIRAYILNGTTVDNVKVYPQLEKGSQATPYSPYKTPIELCKIGDYQDYIRKSTGKNLFDKDNVNVINGYFNVGTNIIVSSSKTRTIYIPCQPNTTYTISKTTSARFYVGYTNTTPTAEVEVFGRIGANNRSTPITITTGTSATYIVAFIYFSTADTLTEQEILDSIQIEQNSQATDYEPFGKVWYIHKETGKYVYNNDLNSNGMTNEQINMITPPLNVKANTSISAFCNMMLANAQGYTKINGTTSQNRIRVNIATEYATTYDEAKSLYAENNLTIYFPLETPTDTIIENTELINQLNAIELYTGINNINVSSANLSGILKLDYYSTDNPYQDVIYSQEDVNKCKLYFNNVELEDADEYLEKITFIKRVLPENGKKVFGLDNFIAEEVEIVIHDIDTSIIQDKVRIELGTLVNNDYVYVPMGVYNIQDTPTRNDNKITIKLRDNACLFDFNYNAKPLIDSLGGTATKMQILQDICSQANVNCNVNSFTGDSDLIGTYDNSIKGRMYVAYITEQAGCIATIDRNGNLIFVPLNNLYTHRIPLSIVSKYVKGTPFKIERIVYELGTIKFETSNDESLQTLYISSENPFISVQNDIDRIFPMLENFELDSVEIQKEIIGNPAIDGYDLIEIYDDEDENEPVLFRTLANNTLTYNGKFKSKYKVEIGLEERTENTTNTGETAFRKTIKQEIDRTNNILRTTVEEVQEQSEIINGIPIYTLTTDTIFQADKPYYKFVDNDYIELVEGTDYNNGDAISSVSYDVYDVVYVDSITDTLNNSIQNQINNAMTIIQSTLLEQTSENFTMWFNQTGIKKDIEDLQGLTSENKTNIENIKAYIEYGTMQSGDYTGSPYILLGKAGSQTQLRILDNRIQFLSSGQETAFISNNTLYINESTVLTKQVIGNNNGRWITEVDSHGNLNTYWGG